MRTLAFAFLAWLSVVSSALAIDTSLQWGVNRATNPWTICAYDSTNTCQPIFNLPPTGGGATFPPSVFPGLTGDVTAPSGATVTTIAPGAVTSSKMASGASAANVGALGGSLGGTLPNPSLAAGAAAGNIGTLGGSLSGTLPNPSLAAGAASSNIGSLGGVLNGTLPNPGMASGAAAANVGSLGGQLTGTLPNPNLASGAAAANLNLGAGVATALQQATNAANGFPTLDSSANASAFNVKATSTAIARSLAAMAADTFNVKNYGAQGNGSSSDGAAIQTALTAAAAANSQISFPCGVYKISQNLAATIPNLGHVALTGGGSNCTELWFSGGSYGLTLTWAGLGTITQSGMTLTTDQSGGPTLESLYNPNGVFNGVEAMDDNNIYDVNFRGHDRYSAVTPVEYPAVGLLLTGISQINFWGGSCDLVPNAYSGICYSVNGYSPTPVNAIVMNFFGTVANNCGTGWYYGPYVEGMSFNAVNSVNCAVSINTTSGAGTDQLSVVNSQFNAVNCGVCVNTSINALLIANNIFIMSPGPEGAIQVMGSANTITGNDITGVTTTNSTGISFLGNATGGSGTIVANNIIGGFASGVKFAAGISAQATIAGNRVEGNTNDYVLGSGAGAVIIHDSIGRNLSTIIPCSTGLLFSTFIQADATSPTYNGVAAAGAGEVVPIACDGSQWRSH